MVAGEDELMALPEDHPVFAGHFPSDPMVPGVLLLDALLCAVSTSRDLPYTTLGVQSIKFLQAVRPAQLVSWTCEERAPGFLDFRLTVAGRPIATGRLTIAALA